MRVDRSIKVFPMVQELQDLKDCILEGRYEDALAIVDELDWISRKGILRNIRSYLIRLLIHLVKNQIEQQLTNSWAASIEGSVLEIQDLNLQENRTAYYVKPDEWDELLETALAAAIKPASVEVAGGIYTPKQLQALIDRSSILAIAKAFLNLTYTNSQKSLPDAIDAMLRELPGGEEWESEQG